MVLQVYGDSSSSKQEVLRSIFLNLLQKADNVSQWERRDHRYQHNPTVPKALKWIMKISIIIVALAVFQLPLYMVKELAVERSRRCVDVQNEIAGSWGGVQKILFFKSAGVYWKELDISAKIIPEIRYRGIYQAAVYTTEINIKSKFIPRGDDNTGLIDISDSKAIIEVTGKINGKDTKFTVIDHGITFPISGESNADITLKLRGSQMLKFYSDAEYNRINICGSWSSPGFFGNILPEKRKIEDENFSAEWKFNNYDGVRYEAGVNLCITAGTYQQLERCYSYATFFLIVFFFTLLAAELITKVNIHIMQYLISAGAPILFYLMTLAFSERIGFSAGYIVSAAVIVAMVTMYAKMFLGKTVPALVMGAIFAASYLLNFVILRMEDFSLISGTIVLAIILGVLMILTGKINRKGDSAQ